MSTQGGRGVSKVAVVNRTNLKNFGSVLQCYALCEAINELGYETEILWEQGNVSKNFDFRLNKIFMTALKIGTHPSLIKSTLKNIREVQDKEISLKTIQLFEKFVENNIKQRLLSHRELAKAARGTEYSKFVCGSDQVWCSTTTYVDPLMYLRFAPCGKRIAYAPSIGRNYIPKYNLRQMCKYIREIPSVSIREEDGKQLIVKHVGKDVPVVADPTLLIGKAHWKQLEAELCISGKYVLCYFLDFPSLEIQKKIEKTAIENSMKIIIIGRKIINFSDKVDVEYMEAGPSEFLALVACSDLNITDSYHGMLFSLIYEKKFWAVERAYQQYDQSSRQLTVLNKLDLQNRYMNKEYDFTLDEIDYKTVNSKLQVFRGESKKYLLNALKK